MIHSCGQTWHIVQAISVCDFTLKTKMLVSTCAGNWSVLIDFCDHNYVTQYYYRLVVILN